jgi:hypothetical protein
MTDYNSGELFYEPPKQYPEAEFEIDGIKVKFRYITDTMPHFDFYGDISETGYRACFPYPEHLDRYGVEGTAKANIQNLKAIYQLEREKRKRKRSKAK